MSAEPPQDSSDGVIPTPYVPRASLQLEIIQNYQDSPLPQVVRAQITRVLDETMSSALRVVIFPDSGRPFVAVLKLYDRRFGVDLRGDGYLVEHWPLTIEKEALFELFVRHNDIGPFLTSLAREQKEGVSTVSPIYFVRSSDDDDDDEEEEEDKTFWGADDAGKFARYEASLWQKCEDMYNCEVKAYEHLKDFQGTGVPRLLACVRLTGASSITPSDLINEPAAKYWDVKGILLENIPGINLRNLDSSSIDVKEWEPLVQRSVDLAHEINKSGLVMEDCSVRNVIVDQQSHRPVFIDFAQSWLKKDMDATWDTRFRPEEDGEFILDDEYWDRARGYDNPGAIGHVMTTRLKRERDVEIKIQFPDIEKFMVKPTAYYDILP